MERIPIEKQMEYRKDILEKAKQNGFENCETLPEFIRAIGEKEGKIYLITHDGEGVLPETYLRKSEK